MLCVFTVAVGAGDVGVLMCVYLCSGWRCWRCQCIDVCFICIVAGGAGDVSVLTCVYLCSCWRCWRCQCTDVCVFV